ncbi:MAG: phenylalanine--tRNA ligase subunit beta [Elusimicrobia bacterium]|nr:phenylalanine--tRNA ligase subunit beta [Elusimicrobiota bacterium]
MKISLDWLRDYLPSLNLDAEELSKTLLGLGLEVSGVERRGAAFSGVVAAKILSVGKHPNADRLSVCSVESGGEVFPIVCGAKNIAAGQIVPLARPGAKLPGGRTLAKTVIRGVESRGMLCSTAELGLGSDHGGILILKPDTPSGADLSALLAKPDLVLEVEVTPNRPDCLSHLGLARELSAVLSLPLRPREPAEPAKAAAPLKITLTDTSACPFYLGKAFSGFDIRPSPGWLCARLEAVGLRPINSLVDITNYVLMDIGQPLHAFDHDKLAGGEIVVRFAKPGERIAALDGKTYDLTAECLVVADAQKPAAVAGVMGGLESSITDKTKNILLESACFAPVAVRRTSQLLRLRSDSSYRFERGTDPAAPPLAAAMAEQMIRELCGKSIQATTEGTAGRQTSASEPIAVSAARINEILGSDFAPAEISGALGRIAAKQDAAGHGIEFTPPTYRRDLATEWDLAEEAARLLGYGRIPARAPVSAPAASKLAPIAATILRSRTRLAAAGLSEAFNQDFTSEKILAAARQMEAASWARPANPLSEEGAVLRPSLLPGLLQNAALNFNRGARAVRLFEIGKAYRMEKGAVAEGWRAAGVVSGAACEPFWQGPLNADYDFYRLKGVVENMLPSSVQTIFRAEPETAAPLNPNWSDLDRLFHPGQRAAASSGTGAFLGLAGCLHPQAAAAWDFGARTVCLFEIDLDALAALSEGPAAKFAPYSQFPGSWRDLSVVVPKSARYAEIEKTIREAAGENLKGIALTDVFSGKAVEAGKISMTLRLSFGRDDRTLTDEEVASAVQGAVDALGKSLGARLRGT